MGEIQSKMEKNRTLGAICALMHGKTIKSLRLLQTVPMKSDSTATKTHEIGRAEKIESLKSSTRVFEILSIGQEKYQNPLFRNTEGQACCVSYTVFFKHLLYYVLAARFL
jgi:hypothetical protein